jgi:hypothetical protein
MNYEQLKILEQDIQIWRFVSRKMEIWRPKTPLKENLTKWREKISPHEKRAGN